MYQKKSTQKKPFAIYGARKHLGVSDSVVKTIVASGELSVGARYLIAPEALDPWR